MQPNGNLTICLGTNGNIFEINTKEEIVWDYRSPITASGSISQGQNAVSNSLFRAYKYGVDHPAFSDKEIYIGEKLELNPIDNCELYPSTSNTEIKIDPVEIYPNPSSMMIHIKGLGDYHSLELVDILGNQILTKKVTTDPMTLDINHLDTGNYMLKLYSADGHQHFSQQIIKI